MAGSPPSFHCCSPLDSSSSSRFPSAGCASSRLQLQQALEVGDQVRTAGGIRGRVISLEEDTAVIEIESGRMVVERRAISGKIEA